MRTKVLLTLAVIAMLLVGTAAIASNMGFKISIPLKVYAAGVHDGNNYVSLPFYNSYTDAASVFADIANCAFVEAYDPANGNYQVYDGSPFATNFDVSTAGQLVNGQALLIVVGADENWIVVGSHNPSFATPLKVYSAGVHDGNNYISLPYHTTATDAAGVFGEIAGCAFVEKYDPQNGNYMVYDGSPFATNFSIVPGEGLLIVVASDVNWTPAHY